MDAAHSLHRTVARLLRRSGVDPRTLDTAEDWKRFVEHVSSLVGDLEQDRYLLEQSMRVSSEELLHLYGDVHGAAERLSAEREELRAANSVLAATLESTADGILVVDAQGAITSFNRRFAEMWRLPDEVLRARDDSQALAFVLDQFVDPDAFIAKVNEPYGTPDARSYDVLEFKDGRVFERYSLPQCIDGRTVGRVWSFRDVTEQRRLEKELKHRAFHDPLTNLANRAVFEDRIDHALRRSKRSGGFIAVMVADLDGFKNVNDSLGHVAGDALLVAVADRLRVGLRDVDTIARLGGDEFAILVDDLASPEHAGRVAQRVLGALVAPFVVAGLEVAITTSIGIAVQGGRQRATAKDLLRNADAAMYGAKRDGKASYRIYEPSMHAAALERLELEQSLRSTIASAGLHLHYQPIVRAADGRITSFEALARWNHAQRGAIPPDVFIPLAEETGVILDIGRFVLRAACRQAKLWELDAADAAPGIAVNVSGRQFVDAGFVDDVFDALDAAGLDPRRLTIEITESALRGDDGRTISALAVLRREGIRVAIDDFGTGYSSFAALADLPVDVLKIDKRFIDKVTDPVRGRGFVTAILQLATTLGVTTVAEGVEHTRQHAHLAGMGCDELQGYLYSRPVAGEHTHELLVARKLPPDVVASGLRAVRAR
jgi:diguanylate cyclase (GGDEF)-like protein/PAS domain S-box-containing protein